MLNVIKTKKIWLSISGTLMLASVIFLLVWGLRLGIDFTGGSLLEIHYTVERPSLEQVNNSLADHKLESLKVQPSNDTDYILRFEDIDEATHQNILDTLESIAPEVENNTIQENRFESIGPIIGSELQAKAIQAIILVLIFIVAYIAWAFRKVSKPVASWKYGLAAIVALVHDILIVTGIFSLFGVLFGTEIDTLFVTALLTILGFSVHDTIVTFDRIRENLRREPDKHFDDIVNDSTNQTLVRSINTSATTLLVLMAIYFFGGSSIKDFSLALIIGIIIGTYSSIFVASPLLSIWNRRRS